MSVMRSLVIAFAMYSKIPMPRVEWEERSMRFALCFMPLVGVVVGGAELGWWFVAGALRLTPVLYAAVAAVIPIVLTGGIHLDGLIDTADARSSYGDQEKKRAILDDPHVGAFGVVHCGVYLLLQLGLFAQLYASRGSVWTVAAGYLFSRSLAGLCILLCRGSKREGLVHAFVSTSDKTSSVTVAALLCAASAGCAVAFGPLCGGILLAGQGALLLWWLRMAKKQFGGVSGDLAGCLVQLSELVSLGAAALCGAVL